MSILNFCYYLAIRCPLEYSSSMVRSTEDGRAVVGAKDFLSFPGQLLNFLCNVSFSSSWFPDGIFLSLPKPNAAALELFLPAPTKVPHWWLLQDPSSQSEGFVGFFVLIP